MSWDLRKSLEQGLRVQIGRRLTNGPLLSLRTHREIVDGISDRPTLGEYAEVEIAGANGASPTYILAGDLIDWPQIYLGRQEDGFPILLGIRKAMQGNVSICGPTRSGKSVFTAAIEYQASRHGIPVITIGQKCPDPTHYSALKAAAESRTRLNERRERVEAPFRFLTLDPAFPTAGFNYVAQANKHQISAALKAGNLELALSLAAEQGDRSSHYFELKAHELITGTHWGASFVEMTANVKKQPTSRDDLWATSGVRSALAQLAELPQLNLPLDHPANIDLEWLISQRGSMYFEGAQQEVGDVGTAACALLVQAAVTAKRKVFPSPNQLMLLVIDEAQIFPRPFLKRLVEQVAGSGTRLAFAYHTLQQVQDDWETICMTQARFFFGAVPGGLTDKLIQASFGTKKTYPLNFSKSKSFSISETPYCEVVNGTAYTGITTTTTNGNGTSYGFSEKEDLVWKTNDTLALNYDPRAFVMHVAPGAEFAFFGPTAMKATSEGPPIPFTKINAIFGKVKDRSPHALFPGEEAKASLPAPTQQPERTALMAKLQHAADQIRKAA